MVLAKNTQNLIFIVFSLFALSSLTYAKERKVHFDIGFGLINHGILLGSEEARSSAELTVGYFITNDVSLDLSFAASSYHSATPKETEILNGFGFSFFFPGANGYLEPYAKVGLLSVTSKTNSDAISGIGLSYGAGFNIKISNNVPIGFLYSSYSATLGKKRTDHASNHFLFTIGYEGYEL